ncbi:MAG: UDP-N-acetylmuramoyl-L-alanyl-D-glutamate--2,6-diaminopimelate ligase [Sedimentisphaerales bacterium]
MTFEELLNLVSSDNPPGICIDSRLVRNGDIFVAVKGTVCDGHDFIDQALANGAKYIVCQRDDTQYTIHNTQYEIITVEDSAEAAGVLAQASRGYPASQLTNLAVTGTNGKTTVAYLVCSAIRAAGPKCGLIGTIIYDTGSATSQAILTTPDCLAIAETQQQMVKAGSKYMVVEASSHALSQNRLAGIDFKAAAFTNLAGDHLDYHKTKEDYLAAKTKLFFALSPDATAVLNKQSPEAKHIAEKTKAKILWYAVDEPADISAHIESMDINGTRFSILDNRFSSSIEVSTPLLGRYNVSNHLAAAGLCLAVGFDLQTIAAGLSALQAIPGRLEKVDWQGDFSVFIDYAHTDDALRNVLATLKPLCHGRLIVVFGCGGDRDRTKRPRMARVAEQLADFIVVTSDNPRTERPEDIINETIAGFENPDSEKITVETDRRKAIELAIKTARKNDIVLIAGKGHETYQIIGTQKFDFSDKVIAEQFLRRRE